MVEIVQFDDTRRVEGQNVGVKRSDIMAGRVVAVKRNASDVDAATYPFYLMLVTKHAHQVQKQTVVNGQVLRARTWVVYGHYFQYVDASNKLKMTKEATVNTCHPDCVFYVNVPLIGRPSLRVLSATNRDVVIKITQETFDALKAKV